MKLADLSPRDQRAVRAGAARAPTVRPAARPSRPRAASAGRTQSHTCGKCGYAGPYPIVEAHVDEVHGAGRIVLALELAP